MKYLLLGLTLFELLLSSHAVAARTRPVHLFIVRSNLVRNFFSGLGQAWATKMKVRIHKEVLPGQFGDVEEVFVPVIDDGTSRLATFEKEFPETESHLQAIALKGQGAYLVWDPTDKSIGAFRLDIPSQEATSSDYAKDEVDAAVVNSQIFNSAVRDQFPEIKVLPVVFGEILNDGPLKYSYLLRPFSAEGVALSDIHPLQELLDSNIDTKWRENYLKSLGRIVAVLNYRFGIYPSLNPGSVDLALDVKTNRIKNFIIRGSKNITVDNFIRLAQKTYPLHVGKRTPQLNRYHYYNATLSQPGENTAVFTSQSIFIPGIEKKDALKYFLKSYISTVREIAGVVADISDRKPANYAQGFLSTSLQTIHDQVVEAKRPSVSRSRTESLGLLRSEFKKRFEASDVAILDYYPHKIALAWKELTGNLDFTFDQDSKNIFAFDRNNKSVLVVAYDIKQENRFTEDKDMSSLSFRNLINRLTLAFNLATY